MEQKKYKILAIDDDEDVIELIKFSINQEKHLKCITAYTGKKGVDLIKKHNPDLILLDIILPDITGYEICKKLRDSDNNTPIIFLSGKKKMDEDKIAGFFSGCDDYIIKPFNPGELICRINAVLKRINFSPKNRDEVFLDNNDYKVFQKGKLVAKLTPKEFRIFSVLYRDRPEVVARDKIVNRIWETPTGTSARTLEVFMVRLRKKLGPKIGIKIETIPTKGYRYNC